MQQCGECVEKHINSRWWLEADTRCTLENGTDLMPIVASLSVSLVIRCRLVPCFAVLCCGKPPCYTG